MKILVQEMKSRGIQVDYISSMPPVEVPFPDSSVFVINKLIEKTSLNKLACQHPGPFGIKLLLKKLLVIPWRAYRAIRVGLYVRSLSASDYLLFPEMGPAGELIPWIRKLKKNDLPAIVLAYHTSKRGYELWPNRQNMKGIVEGSDALVTLSEYEAQYFADLFQIPVGYCPNPAPRNASASADVKGVDIRNRRKFAYFGRLSSEKRVHLIIEAFGRFKDECEGAEEWTLEIFGDGPERKELEEMAAEMLPPDSYVFRGFVPEPTKYIKEASFVLLSSEYEGLPMVFVEAVTLGVPVISTKASYETEKIAENCGYLCPSDSAQSIFETMCTAVTNSDGLLDLSEKAFVYSERFSIDGIVDKWISVGQSRTACVIDHKTPAIDRSEAS
ncbi:glycosyltransferase [Dermabacteraceae bacterium P7006]